MYFFSALDSNYRIKGSRDPLGFQSLWSAAGHKAVKHLSTVSSNLKDFMILCYGIYFYGERDPRGFISFFLKFEQLCAYARRIHNKETSFNGVEFVNKKINDLEFNISLKDTILSNQRAYGIYGKYIRPLRDMGITNDQNFNAIIESSMSKTDIKSILKLVNPLLEGSDSKSIITLNDLFPVGALLKTLTEDERHLYREYILMIPEVEHPQNNLYEVIWHNQEIAAANFQLQYTTQAILSKKEINESLTYVLKNIIGTDKVLHPINKIFTHLLSKSLWSNEEIMNEKLFQKLPGIVDYDFLDETIIKLNKMLGLPIIDLVKELVKRNEEVSTLRGNKAWIEENKKLFRVLYGENGQKISEINTESEYEFPYFLNNYIGLFKQIELT